MDVLPAGAVGSGSAAPARGLAAGDPFGFSTLASAGDVLGGAAALAGAGTIGIGGDGHHGEGGGGGPGALGVVEGSPGRAPIHSGAEDLIGLDTRQLIERVVAARKAAADALDRADAAERAAGQVVPRARRWPGDADGGASWGDRLQVSAGDDRGGGGGRKREGEGAGVASAEHSSRLLLASAVEDFSSAVGEFSEVSRTWLEEVIHSCSWEKVV